MDDATENGNAGAQPGSQDAHRRIALEEWMIKPGRRTGGTPRHAFRLRIGRRAAQAERAHAHKPLILELHAVRSAS
ncbi:hypothetical protein D3C83_99380 [compost metagenome]